jgi:hypothetical protein
LALRELLTDSTEFLAGSNALEWVSANLPGVQPTTLEAFRRATATPGDAQEYFDDHPKVRWTSNTVLDRIYTAVRAQVSYLRLSRVAFSASGDQALMYASFRCGTLCGRGEYFLLERAASGDWRIRGVLLRVIS